MSRISSSTRITYRVPSSQQNSSQQMPLTLVESGEDVVLTQSTYQWLHGFFNALWNERVLVSTTAAAMFRQNRTLMQIGYHLADSQGNVYEADLFRVLSVFASQWYAHENVPSHRNSAEELMKYELRENQVDSAVEGGYAALAEMFWALWMVPQSTFSQLPSQHFFKFTTFYHNKFVVAIASTDRTGIPTRKESWKCDCCRERNTNKGKPGKPGKGLIKMANLVNLLILVSLVGLIAFVIYFRANFWTALWTGGLAVAVAFVWLFIAQYFSNVPWVHYGLPFLMMCFVLTVFFFVKTTSTITEEDTKEFIELGGDFLRRLDVSDTTTNINKLIDSKKTRCEVFKTTHDNVIAELEKQWSPDSASSNPVYNFLQSPNISPNFREAVVKQANAQKAALTPEVVTILREFAKSLHGQTDLLYQGCLDSGDFVTPNGQEDTNAKVQLHSLQDRLGVLSNTTGKGYWAKSSCNPTLFFETIHKAFTDGVLQKVVSGLNVDSLDRLFGNSKPLTALLCLCLQFMVMSVIYSVLHLLWIYCKPQILAVLTGVFTATFNLVSTRGLYVFGQQGIIWFIKLAAMYFEVKLPEFSVPGLTS